MTIESEAGWSESAQNHRPLCLEETNSDIYVTLILKQLLENKHLKENVWQSIFCARIE